MRRRWRFLGIRLAPARLLAAGLLAAVLPVCTGCATATGPVVDPVDLEAPGWTVRTGQAVWRPGGERAAVAGDLIAARHESGDVWVSFSKPPVPIFTARTTSRRWRIDLARGKSFAGRGRPPRRFVWFRLPEVLAGGTAPAGWRVEKTSEDEWTLSRPRSGESIRLALDPLRLAPARLPSGGSV